MIQGLPLFYSFNDKSFIIFSEYACNDVHDYQKMARRAGKYVIGGVRSPKSVAVYIISPDGVILHKRYKYRHFGQEGLTKAELPRIVTLLPAGITILPLICFEMLFPEDWFNSTGHVDFVVHLISSEMQDSHQAEGWQALHKILCLRFCCDVVVSSGISMNVPPLDPNRINLSGVYRA